MWLDRPIFGLSDVPIKAPWLMNLYRFRLSRMGSSSRSGAQMKPSSLLFASVFAVSAASVALADSRIFIVANQRDAYGIDQCLANGEQCGLPAARAYCQSHNFKAASAFRRLEQDDVTGTIPASTDSKCAGSACEREYVAITCER